MTFRAFVQRWVDETPFYRSGSCVALTVRWLDAHVYPAIGGMPLAEVQPGEVLAIINARADRDFAAGPSGNTACVTSAIRSRQRGVDESDMDLAVGVAKNGDFARSRPGATP